MAELIVVTDKNAGKGHKITSTNFGEKAESFIVKYAPATEPRDKITTTGIRNLLDLVNKIYNRVHISNEEILEEALISDIAYLKIKFSYAAGREPKIKRFLEQTYMIQLLDPIIKSRKKEEFLLYARYVESLIAYFKFYGGKDK